MLPEFLEFLISVRGEIILFPQDDAIPGEEQGVENMAVVTQGEGKELCEWQIEDVDMVKTGVEVQ